MVVSRRVEDVPYSFDFRWKSGTVVLDGLLMLMVYHTLASLLYLFIRLYATHVDHT